MLKRSLPKPWWEKRDLGMLGTLYKNRKLEGNSIHQDHTSISPSPYSSNRFCGSSQVHSIRVCCCKGANCQAPAVPFLYRENVASQIQIGAVFFLFHFRFFVFCLAVTDTLLHQPKHPSHPRHKPPIRSVRLRIPAEKRQPVRSLDTARVPHHDYWVLCDQEYQILVIFCSRLPACDEGVEFAAQEVKSVDHNGMEAVW